MPKQSSASKGTKKKVEAKRAAKAAAQSGSNPQAQPGDASNQHGRGKGTKKNKKSEPRKKQYIPPAKPPPKATDPVDDLGLASVMDAQLVVILRKFMKKDDKTLSRALDELLIWLNHPETDQLSKVMMLPVWTHHFPKLALQSGKRLRHATANVLSSLLSTSSEVRESLISGDDTAFFASWVMLAFDIDRSVKHVAFQTWSSAVDVAQPAHIDLSKQGAEMAHYLLGYIESGSSDVSEDAPKPIPQAMQSSSDIHLAEDTQSRQTRELVGSLGSLAWLVSHHPLPYASVEDLLHCSAWSLLRSHSTALPPTRKSAWTLLSAMLSQGIDFEPDQMGEISQALFAAFEDSDAGVQSVLWNGLLLLLQKHPDIWKTAEEHHNEVHDNDVEEEEVSIPVIVSTFFEFIAKRCPIQPAQNYPGLILLLASIPTSLYSTIDNDEPLFEALWTPTRLTQPYFDAALECMLFICKRATNEKARCIANAQVRQAISKAISSVEVEQLEFTTLVSALHKLHSYSPSRVSSFLCFDFAEYVI